MTTFQLASIALLLGLAGLTLIARAAGRLRWGEALPWIVVWTVGAALVGRPDLLTLLAQSLGVQRGVDPVPYTVVLSLPLLFLVLYARIRALRRDLTRLVREIAIRDALPAEPRDGGVR